MIHSTTSANTGQPGLTPPDTLSLTIEDLDRGLTPEQLSWLFDNLNVRSLIRALAKIAPAAEEGDSEPEGGADGCPS